MPVRTPIQEFVRAPASAVACTVLRVRFGLPTEVRPVPGLAEFQADALHRIRTVIDLYGGAILADSVGLGKTHVAAALIRERAMRGRVLVCAPSALRAHWQRHLRGVPDWRWLSHAALSRGRLPQGAHGLIVVDEAHALRNPATRRHRTLAERPGGDLLLLTATPVNNSVRDFYHLVRLFANRHAFSDIGVADLLTAVESAEQGDAVLLQRVAEAVMVRRTRDMVQHTLRSARLAVPRREPVQLVGYDMDATYPGLLSAVITTLGSLRFPAHSVLRPNGGAAELMRLSLLKRLESSPAAFLCSLRRYERLLHQFIEAAAQGRLLDARTDRDMYDDVDGTLQLSMARLALRPWPTTVASGPVVRSAHIELDAVSALRRRIERDGARVGADAKLIRLRALFDGPLASESVLVFTEYRDTAVALWENLHRAGGVALIHGGDARLGAGRASRQAVINRFAPHASGAVRPRPHQCVRILIATDVLAEGLNLQDARGVVSYDMPWNPVRLAQRIGRIDRLGSPHESVLAYAFRPDRGLDAVLGLRRRVQQKLRAIRTVGGDAPWFSRRRAARDAADTGLAELLRIEYARRAACYVRDGEGGPLIASVAADSVSGPTGTCEYVVWVRCGPALVPMVVDGAGTAHVDATVADAVLLAALTSTDIDSHGPSPDRAELGRVMKETAAAARQWTASHGSRPADHAVRAQARAVRRWLASRPGGASSQDTAEADRRLAALSLSTAMRDSPMSRSRGGPAIMAIVRLTRAPT